MIDFKDSNFISDSDNPNINSMLKKGITNVHFAIEAIEHHGEVVTEAAAIEIERCQCRHQHLATAYNKRVSDLRARTIAYNKKHRL